MCASSIPIFTWREVKFLASDAKRLGLKSSQKVKLNGLDYEINGIPYQVFEGNRLYVCLNISRKAENG
jgi:hypothetical protein